MKGLRDRIRWGGPILLISITLLVADLQQWTGGYGLLVLTLFFGLGACFEALSLRDESAAKKWIGLVSFLLFFWGGWLFIAEIGDLLKTAVLLLGVPLFLGSLVTELVASKRRSFVITVATALTMSLWLAVPTLAVSLLARTDPLGVHAVLLSVLMVKGADTGSYFVGRNFGRHALHPVSPKKTREGLAGGVMTAAAVGLVYAWCLGDETLSVGQGAFLGLLAALVGQLSDLQESALKRVAGRKDSGNTIPGLGGFLDMLDSMLLTIPMLLLVRIILVN